MPTHQRHHGDNGNHIPLLYRSLSTRRASYPKYIMLKNGDTPIPIKQQNLGNDNCYAHVLSGHAVTLLPMVDDIADALYWSQGIFSPPLLRYTHSVIVKNLLRVCIVDEEHIHPFEAHLKLRMIAIHVLFNTHWNELPVLAIRSYVELHWGQEISSVGFKRALLQAAIDLNHLKT
jgi:hypothetical protein